MRYADARPTIKSGDRLAWTHRKWSSWYDFKVMMVRLFKMSEYSHVAFALVEDDRVFVVESVTPVVQRVPLSDHLPCYLLSGTGITDAQRLKAIGMLGKYPYSQLLAIWAGILAIFGKQTSRHIKAMECAKFVNVVFDLPYPDTPSDFVAGELTRGAALTEIQP